MKRFFSLLVCIFFILAVSGCIGVALVKLRDREVAVPETQIEEQYNEIVDLVKNQAQASDFFLAQENKDKDSVYMVFHRWLDRASDRYEVLKIIVGTYRMDGHKKSGIFISPDVVGLQIGEEFSINTGEEADKIITKIKEHFNK